VRETDAMCQGYNGPFWTDASRQQGKGRSLEKALRDVAEKVSGVGSAGMTEFMAAPKLPISA